ncbi:MAG: TraB/GumN family protein [Candidatus Thermoplasmatota archaeon]|nr:TraB/GumN family protein [Candidatus Thermoplasmatota archaeon]
MTVVDIDENLRLLGTAHISKTSADAARREVAEYDPDIVAIELCKSRLDALTRPERFDNETLGKVLREGKAPLVLFQSMLAVEQRRMGLAEGEKPGTDLLAAMEAANEAEKEVALVDRDIQTTLRRAWRRMRFREKWKVMSALLFEDVDEDEDVNVDELLENTDLITELMGELREVAPGAGEVLIDERDEFLAGRIQKLRPKGKVLAVIGAGHLDGVANHLRENRDLDKERLSELNHVKPPHPVWKGVKWTIPVLMLGLFVWIASQGDVAALKDAAIKWLALNAFLAALGALIARGHPLSILTAAVASPITSLNPMLAAGWFAGLVQLKVAAPSTKDLQSFLKLDELSLFWKNKVGRVLLVTALANLGSTAGAWIAGSAIISSVL